MWKRRRRRRETLELPPDPVWPRLLLARARSVEFRPVGEPPDPLRTAFDAFTRERKGWPRQLY